MLKEEKLKAIYRTVYSAMPLPAYAWVHKDAELTKEERQMIRDWTEGKKIVREEVAELLENRGELLTVTYFKLQELFENKYGQNALVLMEIGTFLRYMK